MQIVDVEALYLRLPSVEQRTDSSQDALLVKISTDAGIVGWGEVDSSPMIAKAVIDARYSHTQVCGLKELLVGQDPLDVAALWRRMYEGTLYCGRDGAVIHAMGGCDLALWDIAGKALGVPVYRLLGGAYRDRIRLYSSNMFQFTAEASAERAKMALDAGYTAVKFGWEPFGRGTLADDLRYLEALRQVMGNHDIMLDVGHAWDAKTTIRRAKAFAPFDLAWIEEPLHPDDIEGYARIGAAIDIPVAAGEQDCTVRGFARLVDEGRIDIAQVDMTRTGLTQAMKIAAFAQLRGLPCVNHNFTTDINAAASLHFLAAIPNAFIMEYCAEPGEISRKLASNPTRIEDGVALVPQEPGLGVEPDMAIIDRYLVRD